MKFSDFEHQILQLATWTGVPIVLGTLVTVFAFGLAPAGERMSGICETHTAGKDIFLAVFILLLTAPCLFSIVAYMYVKYNNIAVDSKNSEGRTMVMRAAIASILIVVAIAAIFSLFGIMLTDCTNGIFGGDGYGSSVSVQYVAYSVLVMNCAFALSNHGVDFMKVLFNKETSFKPENFFRSGIPHLLDIITQITGVSLLYILLTSDAQQKYHTDVLIADIDDASSCAYRMTQTQFHVFNNVHAKRLALSTIVFSAIPFLLHVVEILIVLYDSFMLTDDYGEKFYKSEMGKMACRARVGFLFVSKILFGWLFGAMIYQMSDATCVGFVFTNNYIIMAVFFIINIMTNTLVYVQSSVGKSIFSLNVG